MNSGGRVSLFGKLWVRITLAASAALLLTLGIVVFAVYELTLASERHDLDQVLTREGRVITELILEGTATAADVNLSEELRTVASRILALHPGSALHMALVRWGDQTLSSARGPERLMRLRDAGSLPRPSAGLLESSSGIRSRSQLLEFDGFTLSVETLGDDSAIAEDARDVAVRTLLAASIGGILGLTALALLVRRSTRLISSVTSTVRQTELDDLSGRIPDAEGSHEVAVLARDVNKMLDDLSEARSARNELIASVSHEIRTPLASALGHTELLRDGRASDAPATIARIDRELNRMTRLVDDLLALSRSSDPAWLAPQLVSAQSILDDLAGRIVSLDAAKVTIAPAPDVMIEVDPDRVLQALTNLVRNAVLHTPEETRISVATDIDGLSIRFSVADDGPGIPPEVLEKFGEAFVRGSESGTGLGLAVSRAVALAHQGHLTVRSDSGGTKIDFVLPIDRRT